MDEDALIGLKCPSCGHVGPETLGHLKARWEERFKCEGCGINMTADRGELLDAIKASERGTSFTLTMHEAE